MLWGSSKFSGEHACLAANLARGGEDDVVYNYSISKQKQMDHRIREQF
jgi:hypothetical protein